MIFLVRKMEAEVVQMTISMFNGSEDACGTVSFQVDKKS